MRSRAEAAHETEPFILALAIGAFGVGVTEFAPMGTLPLIAEDLGLSIPVGNRHPTKPSVQIRVAFAGARMA